MTCLERFKRRRADRLEAKNWEAVGDILANAREIGEAVGRDYAAWALPQHPSMEAFRAGLESALASLDIESRLGTLPPALIARARHEMTLAAVLAADEVVKTHPKI